MDLLTLVKMDKRSQDINVRQVQVNEMLELILKRLKPIAEKKNVEVVLESFRPVTAEIDEVKMTLAISNLVENAIKYNHADGWVHVSLNADHKFFYIKVSDSGIGIPEEDQAHIFERFYRVDKSHSREIRRTGLGLAIVRKRGDDASGIDQGLQYPWGGNHVYREGSAHLCYVVKDDWDEEEKRKMAFFSFYNASDTGIAGMRKTKRTGRRRSLYLQPE